MTHLQTLSCPSFLARASCSGSALSITCRRRADKVPQGRTSMPLAQHLHLCGVILFILVGGLDARPAHPVVGIS